MDEKIHVTDGELNPVFQSVTRQYTEESRIITDTHCCTTKRSDFESLWGQEFSLLHVVQTGSEVHPTYYPMGAGGSIPGDKPSVA
jgi:hypothetical protein